MNDLEKQIEEAAKKESKERGYDEEAEYCIYRGFLSGAKSEAAKNYWQQRMYSNLDIANMIAALGEWDTLSSRWLVKWFKINKKKL